MTGKNTFAKKILSIFMMIALAMPLTSCGVSSTTSTGEKLYVYNWGEYIDEEVIDIFEEETGIDVIYDTFQTNEEMYPIIQAGAIVYDVVCPSDYMIEKMAVNGLLQELDFSLIPNYANIDPKYIEKSQAFDPENKYSVPYCWGTVGILYNTSLVPEEDIPTSWTDLWDEKYKDEILMQDSVRDTFMVGEMILGYDVNTTDEGELRETLELLQSQKHLVQAYVVDQVRDKMLGGEAAMAVIYSGELLYLQEEAEAAELDFELKCVLPQEGSSLWFDNWVIPANAQNVEAAHKWIDFLCRADIAKQNFEYITYATPNRAGYELLDEEVQQNKDVFPDDEDLAKCTPFAYLGEEGDELCDELWKELKSY